MSFNITGFPSGYRYPFTAAEIKFNMGATSAGEGTRRMLVVGQKTTDGAWDNNVLNEASSEDEVILGAGAGSPLHRAARMIWRTDKNAQVSFLVVESDGYGTASDSTFTLSLGSGSNPTATGKLVWDLCGETVEVGFRTSDTLTTMTSACIASINAKKHLPYTASSSTPGVIDVTAKVEGSLGGDGTTGVYKCSVSVEPGKNVSVASTGDWLGLGAGTSGVDGTLTEADAVEIALDKVKTQSHYYVVSCAWKADVLDKFNQYVTERNEPSPGTWCVCVAGNTMSQSAAAVISGGLNNNLVSILWQEKSNHDPIELASALAATLRKYQEVDPAVNLCGKGGADWLIQPQSDSSLWPEASELNSAVLSGLSPVQVLNSSSTVLGMNITTRTKDSSGTLVDWRSAEQHRTSVMHNLITRILTSYSLMFSGKKLAPDTVDSQGNVVSGVGLRPGVVTPSVIKPHISKVIADAYTEGLLATLDDAMESLELRIDPSNNSRVQCKFSVQTVNHLLQASFLASEVNSG